MSTVAPTSASDEQVYATDVEFIDPREHAARIADPARIEAMRGSLLAGRVTVCRGLLSKERLEPIREYLTRVAEHSIPNYQAIEPNCPNFHRINDWDERAYVSGGFHQFSFFPWNQDPFRLFDLFKDVFHLKNLVSGLPADAFLARAPEQGCIARLSFQFYPRGVGGLTLHADPKDYHQLTVPVVILSERGVDFQTGGLGVGRADGSVVDLEGELSWGDVVYFHPQMPHEVARIDPDVEGDWLDFRGRWMVICAVNRLASNESIADSRELA